MKHRAGIVSCPAAPHAGARLLRCAPQQAPAVRSKHNRALNQAFQQPEKHLSPQLLSRAQSWETMEAHEIHASNDQPV